MNTANSWFHGLEHLAKPALGQETIAQLLDHAQSAKELENFYHLTGLAVAIYSCPERQCWVAAGSAAESEAIIQFVSSSAAAEEIFGKPPTKYFSHTTEHLRLLIAPLVIEAHCLAYLIVGELATGSKNLEPGFNYLQDSLQYRLRQAHQHYREHLLIEPLQEQADLFEAFFTEAPYGIAITNAANAAYLAINPAFCEISGFSEEEILGQSTMGLISQDVSGQELFEQHMKVGEALKRDGRVGPVELRAPMKTGMRDILFNAKIVRLRGQTCVISVTLDITQRKAQERALRDSEALFSAIFENSPLPIVISRMSDRAAIKASRAYYAVSGYEESAVIGQPTSLYIPEADMAFHDALGAQLLKEGQLQNIEAWINQKNGKLGRILFSSSLVEIDGELHAISIVADVDARYRAEEALRASEERYRLVADFTGQIHYDWNLRTGKIEWFGRLEDVLGYTKEQMDSWGVDSVPQLVNATDRATIFKALAAAREDRTPYHCEYRMLRADGAYIDIETNGAYIRDEKGAPYRLIGVCKDVSSKKKYEQELKQRNEELMRFTYTVSHDLRSPLITIKSFLEMLRQDIETKSLELMPKHFSFIQKAANKMTALLDELLALSRVGRVTAPPVEVSLQEIVHEAAELVRGRLQEKKVELIVMAQPLVLFGDRTRLIELFQNLLDNATKFFGDQQWPRIEIGAEKRGEEWSIFVRDNGMGIESCYLKKIFGLFEKLNPQIDGTGIGLALVQRIVEVHGGTIVAESEGLGQGATFRFNLKGTV